MKQPALSIRAAFVNDRIEGLSIVNRRVFVAPLLIGKPADAASNLIATLLVVCKKAQATAARLAIEAARGRPVAVSVADARAIAVEAMQERLRRLMIDWPLYFGLTPDRQAFVDLHRELSEHGIKSAHPYYAAPLMDKIAEKLRDLEAGCEPIEAPAVQTLSKALNAKAWLDRLAEKPDETFCRAPTLNGAPAETGPIARRKDHPFVAPHLADGLPVSARFEAMRADLDVWSLGKAPRADAASAQPGVGLAIVETARGALIHWARLRPDDHIADYAIVAPTEWTFHPDGVLRNLTERRLKDASVARRYLEAAVLALDPCVEYDMIFGTTDDA